MILRFKFWLTILFVLLVSTSGWSAMTEFYINSGGNNINAGSTSGSSTYTSTNGNWSTSTRIFTPTDGSTPASTVNAGDFASIYVDGATTAVYITRISTVAPGVNGAITMDSSGSAYGTAPTTSATGRSITVNGAWKGPSSGVTFPFGLSGTIGALLNATKDHVRLNVKNDQTYSMGTTQLVMSSLGNATLQGYTTNPNDGGKAVFTSADVSTPSFTSTTNHNSYLDIDFSNTGASGSSALVMVSGVGEVFFRCVFHGSRGSGLTTTGMDTMAMECESYNNNKSNTANLGNFANSGSSGLMILINCFSHDSTSGTNADGFVSPSGDTGLLLINSTASTNGGNGATYAGAFNTLYAINSNFYNNTGDGIKFNNSTQEGFSLLINNNFIKNGGKGINNNRVSQAGIIFNNGYGAGTQANGGADVLQSIIDTSTSVTYANDITPWKAPTTGDFSTVWTQSAAVGAGRGHYEETDGVNSGTVGFPDIGAAQAPTPTSTPSSTATNTPTPTPTATATSSFTPCAATPTATATFTPTATASATFTPTPTSTVETSGEYQN